MCYGGCDCRKCNPPDEPAPKRSAWTTERPMREGWYWVRSLSDCPTIVQVFEDGDGQLMLIGPEVVITSVANYVTERDEFDELKREGCEWQPVPPPQD